MSQAKECSRPLEAGKGKETNSPLQPPEGKIALSTLMLTQGDLGWTSRHKMINGVAVKSLTL